MIEVGRDQPIDALVLLKFSMSLGRRTDDTYHDSEFIYQSIRWDPGLCALSFFNLFDECFYTMRDEQETESRINHRVWFGCMHFYYTGVSHL